MKSIELLMPMTLLLIACGCDGYTKASGVVVGVEGEPVSGATVKLTYDDESDWQIGIGDETDANGKFEDSGCHAPGRDPILLTIAKDGYVGHTQELVPNEDHSDLKIVLETNPTPTAPPNSQ